MSIITILGMVVLFVLLLFVFTITYITYRKNWQVKQSELRGFSLPNGTIRSMLALLIVSFYLIFIIFGYSFIFDIYEDMDEPLNEKALDNVSNIYQSILTAFTGLSAAVVGFYFGGRSSTSAPQDTINK